MKRTVLFILAFVVSLSMIFVPVGTYAASKTKSMNAYFCVKTEDTVYCTNGYHIFKVNLESEDVSIIATGEHGYPSALKLKGDYLYYSDASQSIDSYIYRIDTKTEKKQVLATNNTGKYAISGSKIYYRSVNYKNGKLKYKNMVMGLNGKPKKSTGFRVKMKKHSSDTEGYYVWDDVNWGNIDWDKGANHYLATPDGDIFLEHTKSPII